MCGLAVWRLDVDLLAICIIPEDAHGDSIDGLLAPICRVHAGAIARGAVWSGPRKGRAGARIAAIAVIVAGAAILAGVRVARVDGGVQVAHEVEAVQGAPDQKVEAAVLVEVMRRDRAWPVGVSGKAGVHAVRLEGAVTIAKPHAHHAQARRRARNVGMSVAIPVTHNHVRDAEELGRRADLERAVAVVQERADGPAIERGDGHQILRAVVVDVTDRNIDYKFTSDAVAQRGLEGAVAIAEGYIRPQLGAGKGEIQVSVAIEICGLDGIEAVTDG